MPNGFVISLGGSLLYDKQGNFRIEYVTSFARLIRKLHNRGIKLSIVVGGGFLARKFQKYLLDWANNDDLDWIGIRATHLNAEIIRTLLSDIAYEKILTDYDRVPRTNKLLIGGGWLPGCSTDYDSVLLAIKLGWSRVINLTRVDGIFDKDPKEFRDAKLIKRLSWKEVLEIVSDWKPGMHFPIDKKAAELGAKNNIKYYIVNGNNLNNIEKLITEGKFKGTIIE